MKKLVLSASVMVTKGQAKGGRGPRPDVTCVSVWLGDAQVAIGTVYGRYDAATGLAEFLKTASHPRWKRMGGWDMAVLSGMVRVPGGRQAA
ncbi:MAG: hypothetical protein ACREGR_00220 [Minisyncoccia bacterium]